MTKPTVGSERDARDVGHRSAHKNGWERTIEDVERMAEAKEAAGWETVILPAGDTAPEPLSDGPDGRWGLVYVVPGNRADVFERMLETATFPDYEVYRASVDGRVFVVTELLDPEAEMVAYVVGTYEERLAEPLIEIAADRELMQTHLQRLDETPVASFEHEEWERFFPDSDIPHPE